MDRVAENNTWNADDVLLPHPMARTFYLTPEERPSVPDRTYGANQEFWQDVLNCEKVTAQRVVRLTNFNIFEWLPRNPGLYHTSYAGDARSVAQRCILRIAPGEFSRRIPPDIDGAPEGAALFREITSSSGAARRVIFSPQGKLSMLQGGIGCIRLCPVERRDGRMFWFMCASSSAAPDEGIPLFVPAELYDSISDEVRQLGHKRCHVIGRTKFLPVEFSDLYSRRYRIQRLYIEVDACEPVAGTATIAEVSVATSFLSEFEGQPNLYASYVTFDPGKPGAKRGATEWMHEEYVAGLYNGVVLTDFDQQDAELPGALFSLDKVLTTPDLAAVIATLRKKFGYFDWEMLEKQSLNFHTHYEHVAVKSVVKGNNHKVNITAGDGSPITVTEQSSRP